MLNANIQQSLDRNHSLSLFYARRTPSKNKVAKKQSSFTFPDAEYLSPSPATRINTTQPTTLPTSMATTKTKNTTTPFNPIITTPVLVHTMSDMSLKNDNGLRSEAEDSPTPSTRPLLKRNNTTSITNNNITNSFCNTNFYPSLVKAKSEITPSLPLYSQNKSSNKVNKNSNSIMTMKTIPKTNNSSSNSSLVYFDNKTANIHNITNNSMNDISMDSGNTDNTPTPKPYTQSTNISSVNSIKSIASDSKLSMSMSTMNSSNNPSAAAASTNGLMTLPKFQRRSRMITNLSNTKSVNLFVSPSKEKNINNSYHTIHLLEEETPKTDYQINEMSIDNQKDETQSEDEINDEFDKACCCFNAPGFLNKDGIWEDPTLSQDEARNLRQTSHSNNRMKNDKVNDEDAVSLSSTISSYSYPQDDPATIEEINHLDGDGEGTLLWEFSEKNKFYDKENVVPDEYKGGILAEREWCGQQSEDEEDEDEDEDDESAMEEDSTMSVSTPTATPTPARPTRITKISKDGSVSVSTTTPTLSMSLPKAHGQRGKIQKKSNSQKKKNKCEKVKRYAFQEILINSMPEYQYQYQYQGQGQNLNFNPSSSIDSSCYGDCGAGNNSYCPTNSSFISNSSFGSYYDMMNSITPPVKRYSFVNSSPISKDIFNNGCSSNSSSNNNIINNNSNNNYNDNNGGVSFFNTLPLLQSQSQKKEKAKDKDPSNSITNITTLSFKKKTKKIVYKTVGTPDPNGLHYRTMAKPSFQHNSSQNKKTFINNNDNGTIINTTNKTYNLNNKTNELKKKLIFSNQNNKSFLGKD